MIQRYLIGFTMENRCILNIVLDFENIAYNIKDLPYDEIIRVLKCNLIKTVERRSQRRQFLPN